ncbi:TonB-dependent receptor [Tenacibaculum retecalamus]|uniref:TonB-dependent receptor n=1 Tax=Tenacibaculum retecalamus TaxID=3018315 RepID=UPI0023D91E94|nr:TonB-dependent receptor plug domain-containing protein [Tenacibaculum retecalamus]WBX70684.1 TonB-dependent receptor [Tenacibaculum retecalamus]
MKTLYIISISFFISFNCLGKTSDNDNLVSLSGKVSYKNGNPVELALIYVKKINRSTYTDKNGNFMFSDIPAGKYSVFIKAFETDGININVDLSHKPDHLTVVLNSNEAITLDDVTIVSKSRGHLIKEKGFTVGITNTQKMAVQSLQATEILGRTAGVKIRQSGGLGSHTHFNLNGLSGNSIRIFIDGIPLRNYGESFSLSSIPPAMIERIETYKGVLPAELTEDALGGGINIILKKSIGTHLSASYSYGSFNTHQVNIDGGYRNPITNFNVDVSTFLNSTNNNYKVWGDNVYVVNPSTGKVKYVKAERFHDKYKSKGIKANIGYTSKKWADEITLGVMLSDMKNDVQTGPVMDIVYGNRRSERNSKMLSFKYRKKNILVDGLSLNTFSSFSHTDRTVIDTVPYMYNWLGKIIRDNNGDPINWRTNGGEAGDATLAKNKEISIANRTGLYYQLHPQHKVGLHYFYNQFTRDIDDPMRPQAERDLTDTRHLTKQIISYSYESNFFAKKLKTNLFYKQYKQHVKLSDPKKVGGNIIAFDYEKKVNHSGYGAAISYAITPKIILLSSAEKALRMPGISELLGNTSENIQPTYTLLPETSTNFNLGFLLGTYTVKKHSFNLETNFFIRDIKDMIARSISGSISDTYGFENLGRIKSTGYDVELKYNYNKRLFITSNFSNFNARYNLRYDQFGSEYIYYKDRLRNAPYLTANTYIEYKFNNFIKENSKLSINYNFGYTHQFYRNWESLASKGKAYIPTQSLHDIGISYTTPNNKATVSFNAKNITNQQVFDNWAMQKPGKAFYLKLTYTPIF